MFRFWFSKLHLEGGLAQKFRFWASKLHFWRKSRKNALFLIFKASFLKEVSHKSFVFDLESFNFEGSLAEKLRCWASIFPQQRKLMGSSAQMSSGVCRCGSQEQVPEEGSGRFRRVPVCASVGSGGKFRKVPECWCSFRMVPACAGVGSGGRFRKVPEGSGVCWCRFRRQVPEGSGKSRCVVV